MDHLRCKFCKSGFIVPIGIYRNAIVPSVRILSTRDFGLTIPEVFSMNVLDAAFQEDDSKSCDIPFPMPGMSVVVTL